MTRLAASSGRRSAAAAGAGSGHGARWTEPSPAGAADRRPLEAAGLVIAALRRAKSQASLPLRTPVALAEVTGPAAWLDAVRAAEADLAAAGRVAAFGYRERPEPDGLDVRVELAEGATT